MIEPCGTPGVICMALDRVFFIRTPSRPSEKSHTFYLIDTKTLKQKGFYLF